MIAGLKSALAFSILITAERYQRSLRQFERCQRAMALLERDQDEPTRKHPRQRIAVEAMEREKLDEPNERLAGQTHQVYAPGAYLVCFEQAP